MTGQCLERRSTVLDALSVLYWAQDFSLCYFVSKIENAALLRSRQDRAAIHTPPSLERKDRKFRFSFYFSDGCKRVYRIRH